MKAPNNHKWCWARFFSLLPVSMDSFICIIVLHAHKTYRFLEFLNIVFQADKRGVHMETKISGDDNNEWVVIKEDLQEWIKELSHMLQEKGIPSRIALSPGCSAGKCSSTYLLQVTKENIQIALGNIEEYYMILHPEIRESQKWVAQGRCPACGHYVGTDARECSDCGLILIIEEA